GAMNNEGHEGGRRRFSKTRLERLGPVQYWPDVFGRVELRTGWTPAECEKSLAKAMLYLKEVVVAWIDGGAVLDRYDIVDRAIAGIDLPMRGIDLHECRSRPIAGKLQLMSLCWSFAGKVRNDLAVVFAV